MAKHFGIKDLNETRDYLDHPILGSRLRECVEALLSVQGKSAKQILGPIDAIKFRSCVTLFGEVEKGETIWTKALDKF
jgi:uncharacterized protein (DUF1810 family)